MTARRSIFMLSLLSIVACRRANDDPTTTTTSANDASTIAETAVDVAIETPSDAMRDEEVGATIARLSESPGDFPSDNFVTNETSYLDVAPALRDARLKHRAYVGVGPEQNYSYLAMLDPDVAYIVDIRRGNLLEHMVMRGCFEVGETRVTFLQALLARRPIGLDANHEVPDGFEPLAAAFLTAPADRSLRDEGLARTRALLARLHVAPAAGDDTDIARIHDAFFTSGLSLRYTMKNSWRSYPTFAETLAEKDPSGVEASFLASEDAYARVRNLVLQNKLIPVVGDFGGTHALTSVAADMRARGVTLGVFYTSNVEQYLFDDHTYPHFVDSVEAMPRDDASLIVRVWFDQGAPHPAQQKGKRTTQIAIAANAFLARARETAFKSYWEVANQR
jgi:hypothetical protein